MAATLILCVTTDATVIASARHLASAVGAELDVAPSVRDALRAMESRDFDAVLVQLDPPQAERPIRIEETFLSGGQPPVIALSRNGTIRDAVRAVRAGAYDYVTMPPKDVGAVRQALRSALCSTDTCRTPAVGLAVSVPFPGFVTTDHRTLLACRILADVADSSSIVLIEGEGGTGKSLLARKVHESSARGIFSLVELNCDPLPGAELEREFFGTRPPFASASGGHAYAGRFELANGGTLLVKAISSVPPSLLARMLRAVENRQTVRPGDGGVLRSDVRLVVTCRSPLEREPFERAYDRLVSERTGLVRVVVPPLRKRVADIPLLVRHFVRLFGTRHGRRISGVSSEAMSRLAHYGWPGNVRELENAIEFAVVLTRGDIIGVEALPQTVRNHSPRTASSGAQVALLPLKAALREPERRYILRALRAAHWNKHYAARKLQISRSTLYKKIKEYGLEEQALLHTSGNVE